MIKIDEKSYSHLTILDLRLNNEHLAIIEIIENYIDWIKRSGLYKEPRKNILSNVDDWKLILIAASD